MRCSHNQGCPQNEDFAKASVRNCGVESSRTDCGQEKGAPNGGTERIDFGSALVLGLVGGAPIVAPIGLQSAWAKPSVTRNAPKSKLTSLKIKMVSASPIVSLLKTSCTYDPQTHQAAAGGAVAWSPPTGGGALGTISVAGTASPTKVIEAHSHEKGSTTTSPQSYSISATTSQLFSGLWSLTASPTEVPKSCTVTGDFAPPTAETVEAYLAAKGLPIFGVVAYAAATDPNHLLGR